MLKRFLLTLLCLALAGPTWAADGIILINQARALAGDVTPGDTAGFPVTLSLAGRYKLVSTLTAPDQNTSVIEITADSVSLDLGGFSILGTTVCSQLPSGRISSCSGAGTGNGIQSSNGNIELLNGAIRGMGNNGVLFTGGQYTIHRVAVSHSANHGFTGITNGLIFDSYSHHNGGDGINASQGMKLRDTISAINGGHGVSCLAKCSVENGEFNFNTSNGINFTDYSNLRDVTAYFNAGDGIVVGADSRIDGCMSLKNGGTGIVFAAYTGVSASGYKGCVIQHNVGGTVTPPGAGFGEGVELGTNVCGADTTCP